MPELRTSTRRQEVVSVRRTAKIQVRSESVCGRKAVPERVLLEGGYSYLISGEQYVEEHQLWVRL